MKRNKSQGQQRKEHFRQKEQPVQKPTDEIGMWTDGEVGVSAFGLEG